MTDSLRESQSVPMLSKYEVVSPLGRGAHSFVYKVKDRKGKFLALKTIDKKGKDFEKIKNRVINEIELHSSLNHENIVQMFGHYEDKDYYYMLLELCEGGELFNFLKSKGRLSESEIRNYGYQLAKGLKHLHDKNILHRDLKLGNLLLTNSGILKICDFGLAVKLTDSKPERDTICGTPNYIPPEMINHESYSFKADSWAFGCILYAMATGSPPFEGKGVSETLKKVKSGSFVIPKHLSKNLKDLITNLINWDPNQRFDMSHIVNHPFFHDINEPNMNTSFESQDSHEAMNNSMSFGEGLQNRRQHPDYSNVIRENINITNTHRTPVEKKTVTKTVRSDSRTPHERKLPPSVKRGPSSRESSASKENKENQEIFSNMGNCPTMPNLFKKDPTRAPLGRHSRSNSLEKLGERVDQPTPPIIKARPKELMQIQMQDTREKERENSRKDQSSVFHEEMSLRVLDQTLNTTTTTLNTTSRTNLSTCRGIETHSSFYHSTESDFASNFASNKSVQEKEKEKEKDKRLMPINTHGLKPYKFTTKNGLVEIREDGNLTIEVGKSKRLITIAPNGLKISIRKSYPRVSEKHYELIRLPQKYHKFYQYASQVCEVVRSKLPKVRIEDKDGKYYLMQGKNYPNFEARFKNGAKLTHTVSSETVRVDMGDGNVYEINLYNDMEFLDSNLGPLVKKALEKLDQCIIMDNEQQ